MQAHVEVWLVSVDDDDQADANVFANERDMKLWLWDRYMSGEGEMPEDWDCTYPYCTYPGCTEVAVVGNASWTTVELPLAALKSVTR